MSFKSIYTFSVNKEVEVEKTETREENGVSTTVKTKVKEQKPFTFAIKKPSRAEREESDLVRAQYLSEYIRRGILPEAILSKTYSNQGGLLDDVERSNYLNLHLKLHEKTERYKELAVNEKDNKDAIDTALKEIVELRQQLVSLQSEQADFYQNTAEFKAKTKLIEYLFTNLVYWCPDDNKDFEPYFRGGDFEGKLKHVEELEDNEDELYMKMKDRALFAVTVYLQLGGNVKSEELARIINENESSL